MRLDIHKIRAQAGGMQIERLDMWGPDAEDLRRALQAGEEIMICCAGGQIITALAMATELDAFPDAKIRIGACSGAALLLVAGRDATWLAGAGVRFEPITGLCLAGEDESAVLARIEKAADEVASFLVERTKLGPEAARIAVTKGMDMDVNAAVALGFGSTVEPERPGEAARRIKALVASPQVVVTPDEACGGAR